MIRIPRAAGLGLLALLCACQPPGPTTGLTTGLTASPGASQAPGAGSAEPVAVDGIGYLVFDAPITRQSRDLLMQDIDKLRATGAREIHLGINSPGGDIEAARGIVDYMAQLHGQGVTFKAYNLRLVASAATYVFLNAQERFTAPNGAFLFHAAGAVSTGPVNAQNLRDEADKLDAYERTIRALLKARTHLTDGETLTYVRRTVVLNADDARRDGVVDSVMPFTVPKGANTWIIANRAPPGARPATPAAAPSATP